jgi:DHA3 family macrolide efflux protein-like MFS transporter
MDSFENITQDDENTTKNFTHWKRNTAVFLAGQSLSLFGSSLVQYAITWYITLTTDSGFMLTLSMLFGFLPQLIVSVFAGVWADRHDRKKLIILSDLAIASSTFILALMFMSGMRSLEAIFAVSFIRSIGAGIQTPSVSAILPQLVPKDKLMKINGLNSSLQSATMIASPALSALLLTYSSMDRIFLIDVSTAVAAILLLLTLKIPAYVRTSEPGARYLDELKLGMKYAVHNKFIITLIFSQLAITFLVAPLAMLTPLLVARSYGEEYWRLTVNEISFFGGTILGGILIGYWKGFSNRIDTLGVSILAMGILTLGMGLTRVFPVYIGLMLLIGILMPFFNVPIYSLLQENVPEDKLGRVFSLISASSVMMPLGMLLFGPLAEVMRIEYLLVICGILMSLQSIFVLRSRSLKNYETQEF